MVKPKSKRASSSSSTAAASAYNTKIFHGGMFKITALAKSDGIAIYRRQENGKYRLFDKVSGTNDNYRAAVKRINRAVEREKTSAVVSSSINRLIAGAAKVAPKQADTSLTFEKKIHKDLEDFAQASFKITSNIQGIKREYMIRRVKRTAVGRKVQIEASLFLITPYMSNKLVLIERFKDPKAVESALERARKDANSLSPVDIVVMAHGDKPNGAGTPEVNLEMQTLAMKRTVYISDLESIVHVKNGLELAINTYFSKLTGNTSSVRFFV